MLPSVLPPSDLPECQVVRWIIRIAKMKQKHPSHHWSHTYREYTMQCMVSRPSAQTWPISGPNGICVSGGKRMKSCMKFCSLKHTLVSYCCWDLDVLMPWIYPTQHGGHSQSSKREFRWYYHSRVEVACAEWKLCQWSSRSSGMGLPRQCFVSSCWADFCPDTDLKWSGLLPCGRRSHVARFQFPTLCFGENSKSASDPER